MSKHDSAPTHGWVIGSQVNKWLALLFIINLLFWFIAFWTITYSVRRDCTNPYHRQIKAFSYWAVINIGSGKAECTQPWFYCSSSLWSILRGGWTVQTSSYWTLRVGKAGNTTQPPTKNKMPLTSAKMPKTVAEIVMTLRSDKPQRIKVTASKRFAIEDSLLFIWLEYNINTPLYPWITQKCPKVPVLTHSGRAGEFTTLYAALALRLLHKPRNTNSPGGGLFMIANFVLVL